MVLVGEANDYVGKGMAGGHIVIRPPDDDAGAPFLLGNTSLYGGPAGSCSWPGGPASASRSATAARWPWWRAWASTPVST